MLKNKIVIIIPYYGKWPEFMQLFFESCKQYVSLDILFITDLNPITNSPSNIRYLNISFKNLKDLINNKLKVQLGDIAPYKLCDIRPTYGFIFDEYIKEYEFWGYGDNDLLYGDLDSIFTNDVLSKNDILCLRNDHLHGPLTIYRNNELINNLFRRSENWLSIFSSVNYQSFDEFGLSFVHLNKDKTIDSFPNDNISVIALKAAKEKEISLFMKSLSKEVISETKEHICYSNGKVLNAKTKESYGFYHWVIEKRAIWFEYPKWEKIPTCFYVTDSGFYTKSQYNFYFLINLSRKSIGTIKWIKLKVGNYIKRKLGKKVIWDTYPKLGFIKKIN